MQSPTQETQSSELAFMGARTTEQTVALSRWTIWRMEDRGEFPKSIKIGSKRVWIKSEVLAWMAERVAERG
jgi:predicted DNA-binding transcriptional regulator AlpA